MIDLIQAAGARCAFDNDRSGFVPVLDAAMQSTLQGIRAAGDCAGIWATKSADEAIARAEGETAAAAALAAFSASGDSFSEAAASTARTTAGTPMAWAEARKHPHFCWSFSSVSLASEDRFSEMSLP